MIEYLPEVGAAVGYAVGQGADAVALHAIKNNRAAMLRGHEGADAGVRQGKLHRLTAQLAIMAAISGFSFGQFFEGGSSTSVQKAEMTVIADHNFDTGSAGRGGDGSARTIDAIAAGITSNDRMHVAGVVANNGGSNPVHNLANLPHFDTWGKPSMDSAVEDALKRPTAVLAITDGSPIGDPKTVEKDAQIGGSGPVFIADVSKSESKRDERQLQAIARATGGQYWHAKASDAAEIAAAVQHDVKPVKITEKSSGNDGAWLAVAAAAAVGGVLQFFRRKRETAIS